MDEVCVAPNEIHYHAGATYCFFNDRHALLEIHDVVVELQSITSAACLSLQQKGIYPYDPSSDSSCGVDFVNEMGDGYNYE